MGGDKGPDDIVAGALEAASVTGQPERHGPPGLDTPGLEHLLQFAQMGSILAHGMRAIDKPEVRLLSIGEEPEKGNQLTLEAHALLAESDLNFGGNVESRHILRRAGDVVVCDGFTGNVCLKLLEGTISTILEGIRD